MCGIAGVISVTSLPDIKETAQAMIQTISHRGPDGINIWTDEAKKISLAHARLSIIDLSTIANQPMHYQNGRYTIVFNGEIYNYVELRSHLLTKQYSFNSKSDTEVLLALFAEYREKCLAMLDGMFAFVIFDELSGELFCARDRFGEKPFYYFHSQSKFLFASEIKAIHKVEKLIGVNFNQINSFLLDSGKYALYNHMFTNLAELAPGHFLWLKNGKTTITKYYDVSLISAFAESTEVACIEKFNFLFTQSITRRLRSDVTVGTSLSGGMDSSAIACKLAQLNHENYATFTARFPNHPKDEGYWVSKVIAQTGYQNIEVYVDIDNTMHEIDRIIYSQEHIPKSTSIFAQWYVMQTAQKHQVKVLLDGQGADEYLSGYDHMKYFLIWQYYRDLHWLKLWHERSELKSKYDRKAKLGYLFLFDPLLNLFGKRRSIFNEGYTFKDRLVFALKHELNELLHYADRSSMAHGIEIRLPFLSHELVEYCLSLPNHLLYRNGYNKYILREACKPILPEEIYKRTLKIGFETSEDVWLKDKKITEKGKAAAEILRAYKIIPCTNHFLNMFAVSFINQFAR
ncbi:MAG: asparagine synthase (glutamine-hydrolyzing) [Bacteroidetes bacterium]|nr:asparagine synthase (glutamine-hydrolyzing) [Bacteroidota bacterium]